VDEMREYVERSVELVVESGAVGWTTTVIDLTGDRGVLRRGRSDIARSARGLMRWTS
jgi:tRNA A37 threonylcarbamoyladenosine synthetase subunit TsaC/SUA5/YrdC